MTRSIIPNENSFHGVQQGSTATLEMTRRDRMHQLDVYYRKDGTLATQAQIENDIEYIELKIGTAVQRTIYPAELFKLEAERNRAFRAGRVAIRLSDASKRTFIGADATSWNLEVFPTVTLRVKLKSDAANTNPSLKAVPLKTDLSRNTNGEQVEAQGLIITDRRIDVEVTDTVKYLTIQPEQGRQISSIHCFTGNIDSIEVELAGRSIQKFDVAEVQAFQADEYFAPQAGLVSFLGEAMTTRYADAVDLFSLPMKIKFNLSNTDNFPIVVKELGDRIR